MQKNIKYNITAIIKNSNTFVDKEVSINKNIVRRVHFCTSANRNILQQKCNDGSWICLHNNTVKGDRIAVTKFINKYFKSTMRDTIKVLHTIKVKYLGSTNTRPARIKLTSEHFRDSVIVKLKNNKNTGVIDTTLEAIEWLQSKQVNVIARSWCENNLGHFEHGYIHTDVFEPMKNIEIGGCTSWEGKELELIYKRK